MIEDCPGGARLRLLIQPKASKTEIVGPHDGALKVRVQAPPIDGRANEELTRFLAKSLGLAARDVEVVRGSTGRHKTIHVSGLSAAQIREKLGLNSRS